MCVLYYHEFPIKGPKGILRALYRLSLNNKPNIWLSSMALNGRLGAVNDDRVKFLTDLDMKAKRIMKHRLLLFSLYTVQSNYFLELVSATRCDAWLHVRTVSDTQMLQIIRILR